MSILRRSCRATILLAALFAAGCSGLPVLRQPPAPAAPISVRVQLSMVNVRGESFDLPLGSGFLINAEGHVVTAAHMVATARVYFPIKPTAHFTVVLPPLGAEPGSPSARTLDASLVCEDPSLDLAVLQIDADEITRPRRWAWLGRRVGLSERDVPRLRLETPPAGAPIVLAGYPEESQSVVESPGHLLDERILDFYVLHSDSRQPRIAELYEQGVYLAEIDTKPGQSGSPVFLAGTREVIGVCISILQLTGDLDPLSPLPSLLSNGNATILVRARALARLLDANDIPWRASP